MTTHYFHGPEDVLPGGRIERATIDNVLGLIHDAEKLGATGYDKLPAIRRAKAQHAKVTELRAELERVTNGAAAPVEDATAGYIAGDRTAAELVTQATEAATLSAVADQTRAHIDQAARTIRAAALDEACKLTEEQWINPLRPVVARLLEEAHDQAETLGIQAARPGRVGEISATHPWAPTPTDLNSIVIRHAWEKLEDTLARLDTVHRIPTMLRRYGLIPTVPGRDWCEDYRWRHPHLLTGPPSRPREFWMANRNTAEPGIYTSTELAEADPKPEPRELVDAHAGNGGTRED